MDVGKHNFNFHLTIRIEDGKDTTLDLAPESPWQDKFVTRDEAELQALTLSRLDSVEVTGWRSQRHKVLMQNASVCVVQMRGYFISTEFKQGVEGYYGSDRRGRKAA